MKKFLGVFMALTILFQPAFLSAAENPSVTAAAAVDKAADDFLLRDELDAPDSLEKAEEESEDALIIDETAEEAAEDKALNTLEDNF